MKNNSYTGIFANNFFLLLQFSGIWHWQYHNLNEYDNYMVCPAVTFTDTIGTSSRITTFALDSR
jgi:hypothetical protein